MIATAIAAVPVAVCTGSDFWRRYPNLHMCSLLSAEDFRRTLKFCYFLPGLTPFPSHPSRKLPLVPRRRRSFIVRRYTAPSGRGTRCTASRPSAQS
jgi:hypothetical protein